MTYKVNEYGFNLIMMMTLDGFQEGTCASDVGLVVNSTYFRSTKEKFGDLKANWFMSDMATQYFGAWSSVLNVENTQYLWCTWHVHHAWK